MEFVKLFVRNYNTVNKDYSKDILIQNLLQPYFKNMKIL